MVGTPSIKSDETFADAAEESTEQKKAEGVRQEVMTPPVAAYRPYEEQRIPEGQKELEVIEPSAGPQGSTLRALRKEPEDPSKSVHTSLTHTLAPDHKERVPELRERGEIE